MESQALAEILCEFLHEFRAPIRAVSGFAQALQEDMYTNLPTNARRYLDRIRENARRLELQSDSLTRLARALQPPVVSESFRILPTIIEVCTTRLEAETPIRIEDRELDIDLHGWDARHFRLLVETLCQYTESLHSQAKLRSVHIRGNAFPGEVGLDWILDGEEPNGNQEGPVLKGQAAIELGIARTILDHYPFAELEARKSRWLHLRLGLPTLGSDGSTLSRPPAPATASHNQPVPQISRAATLGNWPHQAPIMLVDDDPAEWELLKVLVEDTGLESALEWHRDSRAALARLQQLAADPFASHSGLPVVVFVDLRMPQLDGITFLRLLRREIALRHIPAVVLSSSDDPAEIREAYKAGANAFITKPTDFQRYAECLQLAMAFWGRCNQVIR